MRGKVEGLQQHQAQEQDHPRLCGEKPAIMGKMIHSEGSPPPMRGKVYSPKPVSRYDRITPAYAGKRPIPKEAERNLQDHPRLCGEKPFSARHSSQDVGSPPPMRGKVSGISSTSFGSGITPAYAGKSGQCTAADHQCEDHPRLCGEKHFVSPLIGINIGSPPPMRGKVNFLVM